MKKVLIANRGEIAIRIARSARALGYSPVGVYSEADRDSEHLAYCDEAYEIGPPPPQQSYLNIPKIIFVAQRARVNLIHPGYGFLSEKPDFADAISKAGLVFVGPTAESMRLMGDKIRARATVDELRVPRVPGSAGAVKSVEEATKIAREIGFPVLLKASAGGGGKGMRRVDQEAELEAAFGGATREAQGAFGDGSLYVEKFIVKPHHVEIQVFGDGKGSTIHLGERECSIQRRHQKVWEESPSPILGQFPKTREAMIAAAIKVSNHVRYAGAGTFEFIVDGQGNFYFLEMNTRLQVEHPVTEWVTGVDLVGWQLMLADGKLVLPESPQARGCALEVRVYAEDSETFLPAPGPIGLIHLPSGAFVRVDTAFTTKGLVSTHYDPMISKISVWAPTRSQAIDRLRVALDETRILPPVKSDGNAEGSLRTNLSFLRRLVRNNAVIQGDTTTDLIALHPDLTQKPQNPVSLEAALALSVAQSISAGGGGTRSDAPITQESLWQQTSRMEQVR